MEIDYRETKEVEEFANKCNFYFDKFMVPFHALMDSFRNDIKHDFPEDAPVHEVKRVMFEVMFNLSVSNIVNCLMNISKDHRLPILDNCVVNIKEHLVIAESKEEPNREEDERTE